MSIRWSRVAWVTAVVIAGAVVTLALAYQSGIVDRWARRTIVHRIEQSTGARAEIGSLHLDLLRLRIELNDFTLHGSETPGTPPLLHIARVTAGIRILSFLGRKVALEELVAEQPQLSVRFDKSGNSNVPVPPPQAERRLWRDTLFDLQIGKLDLRNGAVSVNDRRLPVEIRGRNIDFALHSSAPARQPEFYAGVLHWNQVELAERRDLPFLFDLSVKFTLYRDRFELDELIWKLPNSELNLRAELPSFSRPDWNFRYRGRLSIADLQAIFRQPELPSAVVDFTGAAQYARGEWTTSGHYAARDVRLPYEWFHSRGIETWGDYDLGRNHLVVPDVGVRELGGTVSGRLDMNISTLSFRTETHVHSDSLADALGAVDHEKFPVHTLHWDARMDVDAVNTWEKNFQHFHSYGHSVWSPPASLAPGMIPVTADIHYDYSADRRNLALEPSTIDTPNSNLQFRGTLSTVDSTLDLNVQAGDLLVWDDFINILRGRDAVPARISGKVDWRGKILGPLGGPTFSGHVHSLKAGYDQLYWDEIDGYLEYSPDDLRFTNATVRREDTSAGLELFLQTDGDWGFLPESPWLVEVRLQHARIANVQEFFGTNYPVIGFLSGNFRGSGTRGAPVFDATIAAEETDVKGFRFDRLSGQLHLAHDEYRLTRADIKREKGRVSGDVLYRPIEKDVEFHITGEGIPLERFPALQNASAPISGQLEFELRGNGPLLAPRAEGEVRLLNLQVGSERQGDFRGRLLSDGQTAHLSITSEMTGAKLRGQVDVGLAGENRISGLLTVNQLEMNTFISAGLHLKQLTGHSSVTGVFSIAGSLRKPDTIEFDANIEKISFNYQFVQIENKEPVRFTYRRNEIRIEQAHLFGPNTDMELSGNARFDRERPLHFLLKGAVNMRLLTGAIPDLHAQGQADLNVAVEGTISKPRITGHASMHDASANYDEFPVGLSHLTGEFAFDRTRLLFERVSAESGGGQLTLSGNLTYGEGPLRFEVSAATPQVRIRYPAGVSWLAGGTLQLSGTKDGAILSGNVEVRHVFFGASVDIASMFAAASETSAVASSSSTFLQNLKFDVQGHTSPGSRIEWTQAHVEIDGDLRLRGTWDHPILLGHIHLLGGEMAFRGNKFTLTRGDIIFASPFELNPELNIEATTVISQYLVSINFSGKASKLVLSYRSDPPLPDSDIIALLAIGSPGEQAALRSTGTGSQNYGATALLSEAISSSLGGRIEHLFGISNFRVDPFLAGTATESNAAARITIQERLTRDLTITYSTNAATSNQYQLIQVEYAVKRDLSVIFLRDINGTNGLDIKFVKHFK